MAQQLVEDTPTASSPWWPWGRPRNPVPIGARARWRLLPWWGRVLLVFAASRVVTTIIFLIFAALQPVSYRTGASPDYFTFATLWDGQWYWLIQQSGYPTTLPHDQATGLVTENAWAFLPGYPFVMRVLTLNGLIPFPMLAPIVSAAFAAGASLLLYRISLKTLPAGSALFAVVLFCVAPLSPILQVSYAESMHLFLLFAALLLLLNRHYLLLIPVTVAMSLTRPSGLAFALLLLAHLIHRIVTRKRDPLPPQHFAAIVAAGLVTAFAGVVWTFVAWAVTGSPSAYADTELVWRRAYIGDQPLVPFASWFQGGEWWIAHLSDQWHLGLPESGAWALGAFGVVVLVAGFTAFLFGPWARRLTVDVRFWLAGYAIYLLAVFFPQSSTFRLLVPLAPGLAALAVPRSTAFRVALVVLGIAGQVGWLYIAWWVDGLDWTPP